jgi:hypothetical protein
VPPYSQAPQAPQKKSRRGLWIILAIVGGILVLACGGCGLAGGFLAKTVAGPATAVDSYYKAIESQDYNTAYSYLKVDTFTIGGQKVQASADVFVRSASYLDQNKGKVTSHSITSTNVTNDTATVEVQVTRNGSPSTVTLQLKQIGSDWKIVQLDNI